MLGSSSLANHGDELGGFFLLPTCQLSVVSAK
jgi:hypothetical protein